MKLDEKALLQELCQTFGPTGCEDEVAEVILSYARPLSDTILRDSMGNLLCLCRFGEGTDRPVVMISAHMDEVGMMITEIDENGFAHFENVGGIHGSVLEGRRVTVKHGVQHLPGVIASKAIHQRKKKEKNQVATAEKLYIDLGASDQKTAEALVSVGDFATFDSEFYTFGKKDGKIKAKALDDRMGCASMLLAMEALRKDPPRALCADLWFCFTVREEIGLSGAKVAAQRLRPELALVLECTAVADLPDVPEHSRVAVQGQGGALSIMDRSTVYDRECLELALKIAKEQGIPVQVKKYVSGGNDAGSIHKSGIGVRTMALSVPTRYLHSPSCVVEWQDFESVNRLVQALLRQVNQFQRGNQG